MPYKDKEQGREHKRKRYAKYVKQELCVKCGQISSIGSVYCSVCLLKKILWDRSYRQANPNVIAERKRKYRQFNLEHNRCCKCGCPLIGDETRYCVNCIISAHTKQIKGVVKYAIAD